MMNEPIAIVGVGCRLPGEIDSLDDLLTALLSKRSAVEHVPADRWEWKRFYHPDPRRAGHINAVRGGFLRGIDRFDPAFFGIAPAEANRLDPQQRLVLESSFRAIEDAGIPWDSLAGKRVAVIVGCSGRDYDAIQGATAERHRIAASTNTGSALSIVSNRVSYVFDLRGPSFTVDTACSSSLTALHCACRAIWNGEAEAALAGGVNVILRPEPTIGFSTGGYLSPDGECRAFSDHANGYVRSEGVGVVYLKPLDAALASGDRIHAIIRATAINQDGRTMGMTTPSQSAQEELLAAAYARAAVDARSLAYVEAHGTGTAAGDPVEAQAIGKLLGRPAAPLFIGSVKTNLGHLESGAGMAGLFKLILTLAHRTIFPNLGFRAPNPKIPFDALGIRVPTEVIALPADGVLFGGVNGFGFGGANAHVVLESPPPRPHAPVAATGPVSVFMSARTPTALAAMAVDVADRVERGENPYELTSALAWRSTSFEHRLAVSSDRAELSTRLRAFANGETSGVRTGRVTDAREKPKVAFVFGGQGSQWWGMARGLLRDDATFAATVAEIGTLLAERGWGGGDPSALVRELERDEPTSRLAETAIAQPCLFAVQIALARRLEAAGVRPTAVVGHSIGELAAAVSAGALTLEEATRIVYWRSRAQSSVQGKGLMAAVGLGREECLALLRPFDGRIEIAAINGPSAMTVAGDSDAIHELGATIEQTGGFFRIIDVDVPFHCRLMAPIERAFRDGIGAISAHDGSIPFYSTVTGAALDGRALDADYWWRNIREPVLFANALTSMAQTDNACYVEIGPQPILRRGAEEILRSTGATYIPTLRRNADDRTAIAECLGALFTAGVRCAPEPAPRVPWVSLPKHPFERTRHWHESAESEAARTGRDRFVHPHIVAIRRGAKEHLTARADLRFDANAAPYLAEHRVQGLVVVPGAAQLEAVAAVAAELGLGASFLEEVEFRLPIIAPAEVHLDIYGDEGHFVLASENDGVATVHTRGRINHSGDRLRPNDVAWIEEGRSLDPIALYDEARAAGLDLGPSFRAIHAFRMRGEETFAELALSESLGYDAGRHLLHPVLLDAMLQTAALGALSQEASSGRARDLFLPAGVERFQIHAPPTPRLRVHARPRPGPQRLRGVGSAAREGHEVRLDVRAVTEEGALCASLEGLLLRGVPGTFRETALRATAAYELCWEPLPSTNEAARAPFPGTWIVCVPKDAPAGVEHLVRELERNGKHVHTIRSVEDAIDGPVEGIVHVATRNGADKHASQQALLDGPVAVTALLRRLGPKVQLWLVTQGVFAIGPDEKGCLPAAASLWGFGRVLMTELANATTTLVDLPAVPQDADWKSLAERLLAPPADAELAFRGGAAFAQRLARIAREQAPRSVDLAREDVRAVVRAPGVVSSVAFARSWSVPPGPDEILIRVRAVGLNFKDVVVAMSMLPDKAWKGGVSGAELGMDCSGIVQAVGTNVADIRPGDEVMALSKACLGTFAIAHRHHVVRKPEPLSFANAAALPTAYLTATLALEHVARLTPGETILVQAGAGGVGVAAIQIAKRIGAEVIATTSSEEKRAFLRNLGVRHVLGSRTSTFHDELVDLTDGRGVDVVLNSLSGRQLTQGLRSLAAFGRFVEIGKADIYQHRMVSLDVFGENKSFHCLDVNRFAETHRPRVEQLLRECIERLDEGSFVPLPTRAFPIERTVEAFATLAQAKHIGKVAVEIPESGPIDAFAPQRFHVRSTGTYLVTGGCSGFGLASARWLVERGAKHVVLVSRSGTPKTDDDAAVIDEMRAQGAEVTLRACAVDDADAVAQLVAELGQLRGVFHAAMVLDDAPVNALDRERFERVAAAKIAGAWNLHNATAECDLDAFVLYSSVAAVVGTPGQGNYAAANAFLEAFGAYRRSLGLPATCVHFGPLDDVGVVFRASADTRRKILGQGISALRVGEAIAMLESALADDVPHRLVAIADWTRIVRAAGPRRFGHLVGETAPDVAPRTDLALALARVIGDVVGAAGPVDPDVSLDRLGLDSLSATQLESWIDKELGVTVPLVRLLRGPSVRELSRELEAACAAKSAPRDPRWVLRKGIDAPLGRLICFPPMATNADVFEGWSSLVPNGVEICSVHLPELDGPDDAILRGSIDELRERLIAELAPLLDVPFAFYGHSLGGWIALEVARAVEQRYGKKPAFVCLGAVPTPDVLRTIVPPEPIEAPEQIGDAAVVAALRALKFPDALLNRADRRGAIMKAARRDLWLGSLTPERALPHDVELVVARATGDELETLDPQDPRVASAIVVDGGHLFLQEPAASRAFLSALGGRLEGMLV